MSSEARNWILWDRANNANGGTFRLSTAPPKPSVGDIEHELRVMAKEQRTLEAARQAARDCGVAEPCKVELLAQEFTKARATGQRIAAADFMKAKVDGSPQYYVPHTLVREIPADETEQQRGERIAKAKAESLTAQRQRMNNVNRVEYERFNLENGLPVPPNRPIPEPVNVDAVFERIRTQATQYSPAQKRYLETCRKLNWEVQPGVLKSYAGQQ